MSETCDSVDLLGCLDGTAGAEDVRHVASCKRCRRERDDLERQVRVLTAHFRGRGPCPTPERLAEAALSGSTEDVNLTDHLNACSDCTAEWKQIVEANGSMRDADSAGVPLPPEAARTLRRTLGGKRGKVIDVADRFERQTPGDGAPTGDSAQQDLPAAAQPEDMTDTSEESASRKYDKEDRDD